MSLLRLLTHLAKEKTWSLTFLLTTHPPISQDALTHLCKLSSLPVPSSEDERERLRESLARQIAFVEAVRGVDTTHVEPLGALIAEPGAITLQTNEIQTELKGERWRGRGVRRLVVQGSKERAPGREVGSLRMMEGPPEMGWDPLHTAEKREGRWFVV
ncbi:hypothetical protein K470DRAFT_257415 [Piedraia hortae CBS 480.64]|uniref:Glutamyl-tRNA amidotransferase complex subunit Gta3 domain-containing protein n=1 Tax=Piedraia hortae CBS 480.64 TaxID=1314780 RepID=A0A6A7BZX0_9PEZI|nr:hypothetical protein K470DRAFT_257415 [Piedraia hortae CBS 480.64]